MDFVSCFTRKLKPQNQLFLNGFSFENLRLEHERREREGEYLFFSEISVQDLFKNCLVAVAVRVIKIFGTKDNWSVTHTKHSAG